MHILAYCLCDFTNFPLNVAADILISTFVITVFIKSVFHLLRSFNIGSFAKWILISAVACSFIAGPEKSASYGQSHWVDLWNDVMGVFHTHLMTISVGLVGIFASFFEEDRYDSPLFSMSAALFASTRAGVEAYCFSC
ncbi:hypothetical protein DL95DRAFT_409437 [Leptodontidium sp. 2 PMI_412]|nr:hypothetical protein BKA61DRAFT_576301 [Leptodontidium sp. MPI-SDFR-AT-0119]KAH9214362.1 hypothetical protein DL95DRAFT_409437 [Leptodontidium sp. 2 PMI_412]